MGSLKIIGSGTFFPGIGIDNKMLAELVEIDQEWIDHFIGTKTRYFSIDLKSGEKKCDLMDLCVSAATNALVSAGLNSNDIDAIVMATATPDYLMPATVNCVAEILGINNISTFQIQSGCSGAVQALDLACHLMCSKKLKNILVIGGDTCNKFLDLTQDFSELPRKELINYLLFGDGSGAVILSSDMSKKGLYIDHIMNKLTGINKKPGQIIHWFANKKELAAFDQPITAEDYKEIELTVPRMSKEVLDEIMEETAWKKEEITYILPPQLSKNMTEKIIENMQIDSEKIKTINCIEDTGNNGNALAFIQIDQLFKKAKNGDRAILVAIESSKWIKAGVAFHV